MRRCTFLFFALTFTANAAAQAQWLPAPTATAPAATLGARLAYDPASQRTFALFGQPLMGAVSSSMWDGANWTPCTTQVTGGGFLLVSRDQALATETSSGGLLMFGGWRPGFGIGGGTPIVLDGTWRIATSATGVLQFTQLAPATRPAARQGAAMVRTHQGVLLFGGGAVSGLAQFGDTWLWNGTTWTQLAPANAPSVRTLAAMAFDPTRNVAVLFGGLGTNGALGDTWEYDGSNWLQRAPSTSPAPRGRAGCTWSPPLARCVLFGGLAANGALLADTWTWDGTSWQPAIDLGSPSARQGAGLEFDAAHQQLLLVGGVGQSAGGQSVYLADTYELAWTAGPSTFTAFGTGCVGPTAQTPTMSAGPGEVPRLGTTSQLTLGNLPAGTLTVPVFVFGSSTTFDAGGGHPLPLDLGILGWPGCQQLVAHDIMVPSPTLATSVTFPLSVPIAANLVGFTLHVQGFVLYAPSGAAVSNGLTAVVGT